MKKLALVALLLLGFADAQNSGVKAVKGTLWGYKLQKDDMTGANTSWAVTADTVGDNAGLIIACVSGKPNFLYYTDSQMTASSRQMWYKFDNNKVVGPFDYKPMKFAGDNIAGVPDNLIPSFTNSMKTAKKVMLRTYDLMDQQKTYTFSVPGAITALKNMNNCK